MSSTVVEKCESTSQYELDPCRIQCQRPVGCIQNVGPISARTGGQPRLERGQCTAQAQCQLEEHSSRIVASIVFAHETIDTILQQYFAKLGGRSGYRQEEL